MCGGRGKREPELFYVARSSTLFVVNNGHILALPRLKSSDSTYMFGIYSKIVIVSL